MFYCFDRRVIEVEIAKLQVYPSNFKFYKLLWCSKNSIQPMGEKHYHGSNRRVKSAK